MLLPRHAGHALLIEQGLLGFDRGVLGAGDLGRVEDAAIARPAFDLEDRPWPWAVLLSRLRAIEASENVREELRRLIVVAEHPTRVFGQNIREARLRRVFERYAGPF